MFPYRRNGGKKRGKGGNRRPGGPGGPGQNLGRGIPGSAGEVLGVLGPTTKALAQALAGHTKMSGQLVHARNVLQRAERVVEERQADRLPPQLREQFFEQLALLKLTLADVEEMERQAAEEPEPEVRPTREIGVDRLRELALRIATSEPVPTRVVAPTPELMEERPEPARTESEADEPKTASTVRPGSTNRERLRLKRVIPAEGSGG
ncbi:MAG: hypothetical protein U1E45_06520 [Geminicoccaceae bacterium]